MPVLLCLKSVGNQHIFLKRNVIDIYKNSKFHDFSITFLSFFIVHDLSRRLDFIFSFPMTVGTLYKWFSPTWICVAVARQKFKQTKIR